MQALEARQLLAAHILDDAAGHFDEQSTGIDTAFSKTGDWVLDQSVGHDGSSQSGTSNDIAQWSVRGLPSGMFVPQITWVPDVSRDQQALYEFFDDGDLVGAFEVDQTVAPIGVDGFETIGDPIDVRSGNLTVRLTGEDGGTLSADAIRLEDTNDVATEDAAQLYGTVRLDGANGDTVETGVIELTDPVTLHQATSDTSQFELWQNGQQLLAVSRSAQVDITFSQYLVGETPSGGVRTQVVGLDSTKTHVIALNDGQVALTRVADAQIEIDSLNRQRADATGAAATDLERQAATAALELMLVDYFQQSNQSASLILGSTRPIRGDLVRARSDGTWSDSTTVNDSGDIRYIPDELRLIPANESTRHLSADVISGDQLHEFVLADSHAVRRAFESVYRRVSRSFGFYESHAESTGVTMHRLESYGTNLARDVDTGQVGPISDFMVTWHAQLKNNITALLNSGYTVSVTRGPVTSGSFTGGAYLVTRVQDGQADWYSLVADTSNANIYKWAAPDFGAAATTPAELLEGAVELSQTDLAVPSIGLPIQLTRTYSSETEYDQGLGIGWSFAYGAFVEIDTEDDSLVWRRGDGTKSVFANGQVDSGVTTYTTSSSRDGSTATRETINGVDTFTVTTRFGQVYTLEFDSPATKAKLVSIEDRNGNRHELTYDVDGLDQLVDVTDPANPVARLSFSVSNGRIDEITDLNSGSVYRYLYGLAGTSAEDRLVSVTHLSKQVPTDPLKAFKLHEFEYGDELGNDGMLIRTSSETLATDATSSLGTSVAVDQPTREYVYSPDGRLRATKLNGVTDQFTRYDDVRRLRTGYTPSSGVTVESYTSLLQPISSHQPGLPSATRSFDSYTGRLIENVSVDGRSQQFAYDDVGNVISEISGGVEIITTYDPTFNVPTKIESQLVGDIASRRVVQENVLDDRGNVIEQIDASGSRVLNEHDSRGLLIAQTSPRGSESETVGDFRTRFVYDSLGQLLQSYQATADAITDDTVIVAGTPLVGGGDFVWQVSHPEIASVSQDSASQTVLSVSSLGEPQDIVVERVDMEDQSRQTLSLVTSSVYDPDVWDYRPGYQGNGDQRRLPYQNSNNVALGATVTATSHLSNKDASHLVDGMYGNGAAYVAGANDASITFELAQIELIDTLTFGEDRFGQFSDRRVVEFDIEVSTDGTNYTKVFDSRDVHSPFGANNLVPKGVTIEAGFTPVQAKFVRFNGNRTHSLKFRIDEIEIFRSGSQSAMRLEAITSSSFDVSERTENPDSVDGGAGAYRQPFDNSRNLALGATVTASSAYTSYNNYFKPDYLVDGVYGNGSAFIAGGSNASVTIDLQSVALIDSVAFGNVRTDSQHNTRQVDSFTIETSTDGSNFTTVFDSNQISRGEVALGSLPAMTTLRAAFDPIDARYVRFASPKHEYRLDEIEVFAAAAAADDMTRSLENVTSSSFDTASLQSNPARSGAQAYMQPYVNSANAALGATVTASSAISTSYYDPSYLTDGFYGRGSMFIAGANETTITIEMADVERIDQLTYGADRAYGYNTRQVIDFAIEVSLDGVDYDQVFDTRSIANGTVNLGSLQAKHTVAATFDPVDAKFVRFIGERVHSEKFWIDEIEIRRYATIESTTVTTAPSQNDSWDHQESQYNDRYEVISQIDATGQVTDYEYDLAGNVRRIENAAPYAGGTEPLVSEMKYNSSGQLSEQIDFEGNVTSYVYDNFGRLIETILPDDDPTDSEGPLSQTQEFDKAGRVTATIDAFGAVTRYHYDAVGRPESTVYADGTFELVTRDAQGRITTKTNAAGVETTYAYDDQGRLVSTTLPSGGTTTHAYDEWGRLATTTSPLGAITSYQYDVMHRVERRWNEGRSIEQFTYGADGSVVTVSLYDVQGLDAATLPVDLDTLDPARVRVRHIGYDADGRATQWTDALGNQVSMQYDAAGRVSSQTDARGFVTDFTYDAAGRLYETIAPAATTGADRFIKRNVLDENGRLTESQVATGYTLSGDPIFETVSTQQFNSVGAVTAFTDRLDRTTQLPFDGSGNVRTVTDSVGRTVTTLTDAVGRPLTTTLGTDDPTAAALRESSVQYDAAGRASAWTDPLGNVSTAVYDVLGNVIRSQSPDLDAGSGTEYLDTTSTYDLAGNRLTATDGLGNTTSYTYDAWGQLLTITRPDPDGSGPLPSPVVTNEYDGFGQLVSQTDHLSRQTTQQYDAAGRVVFQSQPHIQGQVDPVLGTTYQYDAAGNVQAVTDAAGNETTYVYDAAGRVLTQQFSNPDPSDSNPGPSIDYAYDLEGRLIESVDVLGGVTNYAYDDAGRETSRTLPAATAGDPRPLISRTYDDAGNVATVTDALGQTTTFEYDLAGQVTKVTSPDPDGSSGPLPSPERQYTYDEAGQLVSFVSESGAITLTTYDALGRTVSQETSDPDGSGPLNALLVSWEYDAGGRIVLQQDSTGRSTTYAYDNLGREISRVLPDPDTTVSGDQPSFFKSYDAAGNLASVTDAEGNTSLLNYDDLGRLISQVDPIDGSVTTTTGYTYDALGRLISRTDALGHVTAFEYDDWGRLVKTTLPDVDPNDSVPAGTLLVAYDDAGRVISETDTAGRTTQYLYDARGNAVETIFPEVATPSGPQVVSVRSEYDLNGQLIASFDTLGNETQYTYDALGRQLSVTEPGDGQSAGPVTQFTYDSDGNLASSMDPLGRTTTYQYDAWGRETLRTLPDPDGSGALIAPTTETQYDDRGNVIATIDQLGRRIETDYDGLDRPIETRDLAAALAIQTTYNRLGRIVTETDASGRVTQYEYDDAGRVAVTTLPDPDPSDANAAPTLEQTYDLLGKVLTQTDEDGATATWTYDALGRTVSETYADPDGSGPAIAPQTLFTYDVAGNLASEATLVQSGQWLTTTFGYDSWNRQTTVTAPEGDVTTYAYDTNGNLLSLTDASGNETSYEYDELGQQTKSTNENGDSRLYQYDDAGQLVKRTDRNGRVTDYTHDALGRITSEVWIENDSNGDTTITSTYNDAGLLASTTDGNSTDTFTYDTGDRLVVRARTGGGLTPHATLTYSYTAGGQLLTTVQSVPGNDDVTTTYTYDGAGRIEEIAQTGLSIADKRVVYERSDYGQVIGSQRFLGASTTPAIETTVNRDAIGRRTLLSHSSAGTDLASYTYSYDALSRVTAVDSLADGLTSITLDDNGRLTAADHVSISDESFQYDSTGNRIDANNVIGANNKTLSDGVYAYEYDAEGNRTAKVELVAGQPTGERTEYDFDFRNRLTNVRRYDASGTLLETAEYSYDTNNQRIGRAIDSDADGFADLIERFVVDGDTVTAVVDHTGQIDRQFFHGAVVDEVLADEDASGEVLWTLADGNKTIRDLAADVAGVTQVVNHRVYDSFGNLQSQTDPTVEHLFGFTGRDADETTGLHYYRDRWMDPIAGSFLSEDPIGFDGGLINLSSYVGNAPYNYTDPTGNSWFSDLWKKVKREVKRVVNQIGDVVSEAIDDVGDFLEDAWEDTREFVKDHPYISAGLAIATGTWFVTAAGGLTGAVAKLGALASKAVGSITVDPFTASSGIGGGYTVNVGSFASAQIGAGISGTSAFAGASVNVLGVPVWGVGTTVGAFGGLTDPVANSLVGNFTDAVSSNVLKGTGNINVGSFLQSVGKQTAVDVGMSQLQQSGLSTVYSFATNTSQFAHDAYGAIQDVFAPPPPKVYYSRYGAPTQGTSTNDGVIQQVGHVQVNPYASEVPATSSGLTAVNGQVNFLAAPNVDDAGSLIDFDWINGASREQPPLNFSRLPAADALIYEDFTSAVIDDAFAAPDFVVDLHVDLIVGERGTSYGGSRSGDSGGSFTPDLQVELSFAEEFATPRSNVLSPTPTNSRGVPSTFTADPEPQSSIWAGTTAFAKEFGFQTLNAIIDEIPWLGSAKGAAEAWTGKDARGDEIGWLGQAGGVLNMIPGGGLAGKAVGGIASAGKGLLAGAVPIGIRLKKLVGNVSDVAPSPITRPLSSPAYSVELEVNLKPGTFKASDGNHFRQANRQLYEAMQADPVFAKRLEAQYPGVTQHVTPGPKGGMADTSPPGLSHHHVPDQPGQIQIVPRNHHQAPGPVQQSLHPNGKGGRANWGGGRTRTRP